MFPPFITEATPLKHDQVQNWCSRNLLSEVETFADLIPTLYHAFVKSEDDLRLMVRDKFLDKNDFMWPTVSCWVEFSVLTSAQYLSAFSM